MAFATLRHLVGQDPLVGVNMFAYVLIQTVIPISLTVVVRCRMSVDELMLE